MADDWARFLQVNDKEIERNLRGKNKNWRSGWWRSVCNAARSFDGEGTAGEEGGATAKIGTDILSHDSQKKNSDETLPWGDPDSPAMINSFGVYYLLK